MSSVNIRTLWAVLIIVLFALILLPGIPYWLFLLPLLAAFLFVSMLDPMVGLAFIAFTHNFSGLVRWKDPDAILLAGFGTILILIYFVGLIIRSLLPHRFNIRLERTNWWASKAMFLVWLLFLTLIFLNIIANWKGALSTLMMFREYIVPLLLLPVAVSVLSYRPRDCKWVLLALFLGSAIVALVSVVHYAIGIPIPFPRWVTYFNQLTGISTDIVQSRTIFGILLPRAKHLLGLSSAGAGGVYFITMAFVGYFLARHFPIRKWRLGLYLGSLVNAVAAVLTLSFSMIVAFVCITTYLYLALMLTGGLSNRAVLQNIVLGTTLVLIFLLLERNMSTGFNLIEYISGHLENKVIPFLTNFENYLFGEGLGLKSGDALGLADDVLSEKYQQTNDQWFLVVLYQLGFLGFFLAIAFFALPLWMSVKVFRRRDCDEMGQLSITAGIIVAGFIAFMHGAAPIERLFSTPMVIAIAVIMVTAKGFLGSNSSTIRKISNSFVSAAE